MRIAIPVLLALAIFSACHHNSDLPPRLLVFTKTEGFRHQSIANGIEALRELCRNNNLLMDTTEDASRFTEANLRRYAAVVFLHTTGDVLQPPQEADFERYIQAGGGYVGIHAATDTEYGWKWYGGLAGAYFDGHPAIQEARLQVHGHDHEATKCLHGEDWKRTDEWYNFKEVQPDLNVLLSLDESSYSGGTMGKNHPVSWHHAYDGGRAFYTAMGHTPESWTEPDFLAHLLGGIQYAIGKNGRLAYEKCRTERKPDPTRFVKTVLADELTEPMEFDMLPDGKILLCERRGALKLYDPSTGLMRIVRQLPVHSEHEDGLMGLKLDPHYAQNHFLYLYYSPVEGDVNRLSRFIFIGDSLDRASEKKVLDVSVQRKECCHAGGSIEFDEKGHLFLSTGDNTNPFASEGYAPTDQQPGRSAWDAQRSSGNTKDLRGKILRISPQPDGSYTCPSDNLFAADTTKGRPEIYVMGCRNPFRISVDPRRDLLFWGEVGPDAGEPDSARGPAGHDEVNRARKAGFFGWPYFVGNNKPYRAYDYKMKKSGAAFNPDAPQNLSPNNTGSTQLPPAQPAFIWYPYGPSEEFPLTGTGGRNAMAGPVYYSDKYPKETRFPDYYNGKLITYDWMRGWMMAVTVDSMGNFSKMERIADSVSLSRPMDMMVDKNGSIWVLEYGKQWFSSNPDARLSRIDFFRGNRPPIPELQAPVTAAAASAILSFSSHSSRDYDGDALFSEWYFGEQATILKSEKKAIFDGQLKKRSAPNAVFCPPTWVAQAWGDSVTVQFPVVGKYDVRLRLTDAHGAVKEIKKTVQIGNQPPEISWNLHGANRSFYKEGSLLHYAVQVSDKEDGALGNGILPEQVAVNIEYLATGFDITQIAQGHQTAAMQASAEYARGKILIDKSDCSKCHDIELTINGPAYKAVAARYRKDDFAVRNLSLKIRVGGSGTWGERAMSAHPQLSEQDAGEMVRWIISLGDPPKLKPIMPVVGDFPLFPEVKPKPGELVSGTFLLQATYRDRGNLSMPALTETAKLALRPLLLQAENADSIAPLVTAYRSDNKDTTVLNNLKDKKFFSFQQIDLQGIQRIVLRTGSGDKKYTYSGGRVEIHLDYPAGPLLGKAEIPAKNGTLMTYSLVEVPISAPPDGKFHDLYFVFQSNNTPWNAVTAVDWVRMDLR